MRSVDPDSLLLRMGEYDLGNESDEPYEFQVFSFAVGLYYNSLGTQRCPEI